MSKKSTTGGSSPSYIIIRKATCTGVVDWIWVERFNSNEAMGSPDMRPSSQQHQVHSGANSQQYQAHSGNSKSSSFDMNKSIFYPPHTFRQ